MRARTLAAAVGTAACLLGAPVALAASTQTGGRIRVFVTNTSATRGKVLVTGAIGDYGTTLSEDADGKVDPNGNFAKVTLKHGGFIVDTTALSRTLTHARPVINTTDCSFVLSDSGSSTIRDGTGAYTGVSGTLTLSVIFAGISQKTAKGCNFADNAPSYGQYQSIIGTGSVSFK